MPRCLNGICQPTLYIDEHTSIDTTRALLEEEKFATATMDQDNGTNNYYPTN